MILVRDLLKSPGIDIKFFKYLIKGDAIPYVGHTEHMVYLSNHRFKMSNKIQNYT